MEPFIKGRNQLCGLSLKKQRLAEAEVEYEDYESDQIWVKFPIKRSLEENNASGVSDILNASLVIWTTTPWTIPGNRAICYSDHITYGLYNVTSAAEENWVKTGEKLILRIAWRTDF